jgi:hypothetical protein
LKDDRNYEILAAKGFNEMIFIKLKFRGDFELVRKKKIDDSLYIQNKVPFSCDYIIGYKWNEKRFYRLKGFVLNDFTHIFNKRYKPKDKSVFLSHFWVNELDFDCLFDFYWGKGKKNNKSPCIQSCSVSDPKFLKVRTD